MKSLLQKIDIRFLVRAVTFALLGMQVALIIIFLTEDQMTQASSAFTLAVWMILALFFESKAYNLKEQNENLAEFLNTPPVDSEGGEA
jgi:hypothetical protein